MDDDIKRIHQKQNEILSRLYADKIHQAVIDERMRIARALYGEAHAAREHRPDAADALELHATSLVYSVYPWQEWFDMGPIHGGK